MCDSLWGDEFKTPEKPAVKKIIKKIKGEKEEIPTDTTKLLKTLKKYQNFLQKQRKS